MKILDQQDNEIKESDVDTSLGHLVDEQLYIDTTAAQPEVLEKYHYEVETWYFTDGTSMNVSGNDDATVKIIDDQQGIFEYVDQGEGKQYKGATVKRVVDVKHKDAVKEKKNYENIKRYVLYTDEELAAKKAAEEKQKKQDNFIENGPDQLATNTANVEDLLVTISELVGSDK